MNIFEFEKITPSELKDAGLPKDPSKFEEDLKGALLEKRKIREKVLSAPKDERLPEMKYPTECPVKNWKDLFEMDASMDEYTKRLFFERIESEYKLLSYNEKDEDIRPIFRESKKRVDYILEKQIRSGIKKHIQKVSDVNDGAVQGVNFSSSEYVKRLNEKTTFIVGLLAEAGIDTPSHFTHKSNISEIQNIPLFIRVVNRLKGIYSNAFEILYCYRIVRDYGESFLETVISGEEKIRFLNKSSVVRSVIEEKYIGDPTILRYSSGDPYLAEVARDTREENAVFAATVIQKIREAQQEKVSKSSLDSFLYFTRLVSKNRDIVEKMEWSSEFLQKNNMMYENLSTIILFCAKAPNLLPLSHEDENNWKTKKTLGWKFLEETNPCIVEMKEKFGIPDSSDRIYLDFHGDFYAHAQQDIAKLRFLSDHPEFQVFIAEKFFVRNINDLVKYTNFILEKRSRDSLLSERIDASYFLHQSLRGEKFHGIEDTALLYEVSGDPAFIRWLPTLYKETGRNPIDALKDSSIGHIEAETNAWKNWHEHKDDFHTAVSLGLFVGGDPKDRLYKYKEFSKIIHQPELRAFVDKNADIKLFDLCLDDREILKVISEKWLGNQGVFYRAKTCGIFAMENYERNRKHVITEYESIISLFANDQLLNLIEENPDIPLMNMWIDNSCGSGRNRDQCDSLLGWAQDKESFRNAKFLGIIDKRSFGIYKYYSKNFGLLGKIEKEDILRIKEKIEKMASDFSVSKETILAQVPLVFLRESLKDETVYRIALESRPLFLVKFDEKYSGENFLQNGLDWICKIDTSLREKFLLYIREGNIIDGIDEELSSKNFVFLSAKRNDDINAPDNEAIERAWWRETAPWRERRRSIDFLSLSGFPLKTEEQLQILQRLAKKFDMRDCARVYRKYNPSGELEDGSELKTFALFSNYFGLSEIPNVYKNVKALLDGVIPKEISNLVVHSGETGIQELKKYEQTKIQQLIFHEENIDPSACSQFELEIYRYLTRFDTSTWARPGYSFENILKNLQNGKLNHMTGNVHSSFETQEVKFRGSPRDPDITKFKEGFLATVKLIKSGLHPYDLETIKHDVKEILLQDIEAKQTIATSGRRNRETGGVTPISETEKSSLERQKKKAEELLESVDQLKNKEDFFKSLSTSGYFLPIFEEVIPRIVIADFFEKNPQKREFLNEIVQTSEINVANIQKVQEFFSDQIKDHAVGDPLDTERSRDWLYPGLNSKQRKFLKRFVFPRGLSDFQKELEKAKGDVLPEKFIFQPSRFILGEMSGYLADACWTARQNIVRENQNMTPVVCVDISEEIPSIQGAFLIFENSINKGNDNVLVLRGINPQDKLLRNISAGSFCEEVIKYAKNIAKKKSCKYIIANTGTGVISNRPGVVSYFHDKYPTMQPVQQEEKISQGTIVQLDQTMNFNGYDITKTCQIIWVNE